MTVSPAEVLNETCDQWSGLRWNLSPLHIGETGQVVLAEADQPAEAVDAQFPAVDRAAGGLGPLDQPLGGLVDRQQTLQRRPGLPKQPSSDTTHRHHQRQLVLYGGCQILRLIQEPPPQAIATTERLGLAACTPSAVP